MKLNSYHINLRELHVEGIELKIMVSKKEVKYYYSTVIIAKTTGAEFLDQDHESATVVSIIDQDCHNAFLTASPA